MKRFIPFDPDQPLLLPPDLREALPEGHTALLLLDLVEELDSSEVHAGIAEEQWGGKPGFDPRLMVRTWNYAYATGLRSSRKSTSPWPDGGANARRPRAPAARPSGPSTR